MLDRDNLVRTAMKKLILFFVLFYVSLYYGHVYLEYGRSGGRFGDDLISYMHTKYISYITGIPVVYKPFHYSEKLTLSDLERTYCKHAHHTYTTIEITDELTRDNFNTINTFYQDNTKKKKKNIIIHVPYFPENIYEYRKLKKKNPSWHYFSVNWHDTHFKSILKKMVGPKHNLKRVSIPEDTISIAIHIRNGGGFDGENAYLDDPLKFPPLSYYSDSLNIILSMLEVQHSYYVYLFTDHQHPEELLTYFKALFPSDRIRFDCRLEDNRHDNNVLEDFFSLISFNCLIRPQSNFSISASKLADYIIEIEPTDYSINEHRVIITQHNVIM